MEKTHTTSNSPESESKSRTNSEFVRSYVGIISIVISILIIAIFWGFNLRHTKLIRDNLTHEARAFFQEIVKTRHWIIKQDGVYVKKKPGMRIDPFLAEIEGLDASITDEAGSEYLLRNHAAITKMISDMATEERLFGLNITSLTPLNILNEPDAFERAALDAFEKGNNEVSEFEKTPSGTIFRYMAPLLTEETCLKCHGGQGYAVGDIRGGISISIPASHVMKEVNETRIYILISAIVLLTLLISLIVYIAKLFIIDLDKSEKKLVVLATTDYLTGLLNRREGEKRFKQEMVRSARESQSLAVLVLDIDLFKQINDNFGHQAGDEAIKRVAEILVTTLRGYDIICRYGGEEYLVVLPATGLKKSIEIAERIRQTIANEVIQSRNGKDIRLTISIGVSALRPDDTLDSLLYRADNALFIAKEEGRNQVQHLA